MADDNTPELNWGPKDGHRLVNTRLPRVDGFFKACGTAKYTHDVRLPGMVYGMILRSPHARATVKSLDLGPALKIRGVVAAVAGSNRVDYEGTPVAAVAAITPEIADDAIHAIAIEYNELPFVVTAEQAMAPGAPQIYNENAARGNRRPRRQGARQGSVQDVEAALKTCDAVVEAEYRTPTQAHNCLETHGVVVDYRGGDSATVYCSTQGTFSIPGDASRALGVPVTGVVQYMGGGFGSKNGIGQEGRLACELSKQANVPVKLMLTRQDEFLTAGNGVGSWQKFRAGVTKDGNAVAITTTQYGLGGIGGGNVAPQPYAPYGFGISHLDASAIHTNIDSARALRAPGAPPACFAMEGLMDELAYAIGMDPLEFRKKNLRAEAHKRQLDRAAEVMGWSKRSAVPGGWPGVLKRGFGCACGVWGGAGNDNCDVEVSIAPDGSVTVACGSQDLGTGTRTVMVAVCAEELGLDMADVHEKLGNSNLGQAGFSGGSTTCPSIAPAVKVASYNAKQSMANLLAPVLGTTADKIVFADRTVSGNGKSLNWKDACAALGGKGVSEHGRWQGSLSGGGTHGASMAEVEVDTETGHVRVVRLCHVQDCGLPINRLAVESQINGGMVSGVGFALLEGRVMDQNLGVMVNSSMMDYKIPGCLEMPEFIPLIDDGDDRNVVIGMGEPPTIPPAAAIANAVFNACGVRVRDLPITPDKILMGLTQKA
jgi:xanthine dehydrogenase YagR molybdenum-binding subunit